MQVTVSGKQIDVGSALQNHVEGELTKAVEKYFDRAVSASVVFSKEAHLFKCDIHVNEGTQSGIAIKGVGESVDVYASFDDAREKIEKQLRRYKRRLKNHHKGESKAVSAIQYILESNDDEVSEHDEVPVIIAENESIIETLSVSEAVMRMDLGSLPALMFVNSKNGRVNMIYLRADGNIAWVDSKH